MRSIYHIPSFVPSKGESSFVGWEFSPLLDPKFVEMAMKEKMLQRSRDIVQEDGLAIISAFGLEEGEVFHPYSFFENSWFLEGIKVPGDSTDLYLTEPSKLCVQDAVYRGIEPNRIEYMPHNINSVVQAACLFSLFTNWANTTSAVIRWDC